jgi:hypothetical protein
MAYQEHGRGLCGHVVDDDELRVRCQRSDDRVHDVGSGGDRMQVDCSKGRAGTIADGVAVSPIAP